MTNQLITHRLPIDYSLISLMSLMSSISYVWYIVFHESTLSFITATKFSRCHAWQRVAAIFNLVQFRFCECSTK